MSFPQAVIGGVGAVLAGMLAWGIWYWHRISQEVPSEVGTLDPEGERGTALVVYHPGRRGFLQSVIDAFGQGLVSKGWRVEITTASSQAPTVLGGYDFLAFGGPTYMWSPARPIKRYVGRLGDLQGKPTVIIITGFGSTDRSSSIMENSVREANGRLVSSLSFFKLRPNDEEDPRPNEEVALEMATRAGQEVPLPQE
jgi:flavorubredoxin